MNGKDDFKQFLLGLLSLVLVVGIIVVGVWQFRMRRRAPAEQAGGSTFVKEVIAPGVKVPKKAVKAKLEKKSEDKPSSKAKDTADSQHKLFTIQVGSFQDKTKAEIAAAELKKKGYTPELSTKDLAEKGVWYRVWIGDFDSIEEGSGFLNTLKKEYKDSFIKLR